GHLDHELVNLGVAGGELEEGGAVAEPILQIRRALAAGFGMDEVGERGPPGRRETFLDGGEVLLREAVERIGAVAPSLEQVPQDDRLLRSDAHTLAENGVEPADRVADRDEPARRPRQPLEMAAHARREIVAGD